MKPDAKIEAEGLRAYEQMRAFEQLERRRVPLIYAGFVQVLLMCGVGAALLHHQGVGLIFLGIAIVFGVSSWINWRRNGELYRQNQAKLAELKRAYGEDLPWLQVEKHLAALKRLEQELAEDRDSSADLR